MARYPKTPKIKLVCVCGKDFFVNKARLKTAKYCSVSCKIKFRTVTWGYKISASNKNKSKRGHIVWNKGLKGFLAGERHYNWSGNLNIQAEKKRLRSKSSWAEWRSKVFTRDKYMCKECGRSGYLEPHHIIPLRVDLSKVFDVNNGITLCRDCHKKTIRKEELFADKYVSLIEPKSQIYF